MEDKADSSAIDRAHRIALVFMDAERRQRDRYRIRAFVERRNNENWIQSPTAFPNP